MSSLCTLAANAQDPAAPAPAPAAAPAAEPESETAAEPVQTAPRRFTPVVAPKRPEAVAKKPAHAPRDKGAGDRRQAGKLTVSRALNEDEGARARSLHGGGGGLECRGRPRFGCSRRAGGRTSSACSASSCACN
jgi:hypothetical protein